MPIAVGLEYGIRLDPDWIDLQLAGKWKQKYLEEHGTKCNNPLKVSPIKPLWVVDVEGERTVPGRDCTAFVALSYRWRSHSWPRVDREMPVEDQLPHSLGKRPSWSWAGWQGRISDGRPEQSELLEIGNWVNHGAVEETIPITCWFTSHSAEGAALRNTSPTWYENRDA